MTALKLKYNDICRINLKGVLRLRDRSEESYVRRDATKSGERTIIKSTGDEPAESGDRELTPKSL